MTVVKSKDRPVGLGLQPTSCGIGILICELDPNGSASSSSAARRPPARLARPRQAPTHAPTRAPRAGLKVGDIILSIDGTVPSSAKHAVQLISGAEYCIKFVCVGIDQSLREASQKSSA